MTDNETKKALECCTTRDGCKSCPRSYNGEMCRGDTPTEMIRDALDLINRLEADNSNLTSNLTSLQNNLTSAKAENERLCVELDELIIAKDLLFDEAEALIKKAKTEAVKEFAEIVKANKHKLFNYIYSSRGFDEQIDNFAKETVGE